MREAGELRWWRWGAVALALAGSWWMLSVVWGMGLEAVPLFLVFPLGLIALLAWLVLSARADADRFTTAATAWTAAAILHYVYFAGGAQTLRIREALAPPAYPERFVNPGLEASWYVGFAAVVLMMVVIVVEARRMEEERP